MDKSLKNCPEKPAFGATCFSVCITSLKKNKKIITNRKGGAGGRWSYFIFQHSDLCKQTQVLLPINRPRSCCLQDYQADMLKNVHSLHTPTSLFQLQKKAKKKKKQQQQEEEEDNNKPNQEHIHFCMHQFTLQKQKQNKQNSCQIIYITVHQKSHCD